MSLAHAKTYFGDCTTLLANQLSVLIFDENEATADWADQSALMETTHGKESGLVIVGWVLLLFVNEQRKIGSTLE